MRNGALGKQKEITRPAPISLRRRVRAASRGSRRRHNFEALCTHGDSRMYSVKSPPYRTPLIGQDVESRLSRDAVRTLDCAVSTTIGRWSGAVSRSTSPSTSQT